MYTNVVVNANVIKAIEMDSHLTNAHYMVKMLQATQVCTHRKR